MATDDQCNRQGLSLKIARPIAMLSKGRSISFLMLLLLAGAGISLHGQHHYERIYTMEDGLPALDLDGIFFTADGSIWTRFASGEYISHFDGIQWTNERFSDHGLPAGMLTITADDQGLWFYKQESDSVIITCRQNKHTWKIFHLPGQYTFSYDWSTLSPIALDHKGNPHAYSAELDSFVLKPEDKVPPIPRPDLKAIGLQYYFSSGTPVWTFAAGETKYLGTLHNGAWQLKERIGLPFITGTTSAEYRILEDRLFFLHDDKKAAVPIPSATDRPLTPLSLIKVKPWSRSRLAVQPAVVVMDPLTKTLSLFALDSLGNARLILDHVRRDLMYDFAQDKQGRWWYATANGMVRTDPAIRIFQDQDPNMVTGLHAIGEDTSGRVWMGGYTGQGGFSRWDGHQLSHYSPGIEDARVLPGSYTHPDGYQYFFTAGKGLLALSDDQASIITAPDGEPLHGYYFLPLSTGDIGMGLVKRGLGIARLNRGTLTHFRSIGKEKGLELTNVQTLSEDHRARIWMGRLNQGIALYDPARDTAITWPRVPGVPCSIGALSMCTTSDGTLWIGAHNGLYRLPQPEQFDYIKDHPSSHWQRILLPGNDTSRVSVIKELDQYLVIGTVEGLYLRQRYGPRTFTLRYGEDLPAGGTEQNAVLLDSKGNLWIGTESGALSIDLDQLRFDTSSTSLRLASFTAGGKVIPATGSSIGRFPAEHRNITFFFLPSGNTSLEDRLFYDVTVIRDDQDTLYRASQSRDRQVELPYLPAGNYIIHITAFRHGVEVGHTTCSFAISRLLKENPWFWSGLILLILGMIWIWLRSQAIRQRQAMHHQLALEGARRERDTLKAKALGNFFNPHFLNNSLHWVQSRYRKDPETAALVGRLAQNVDLLFANTRSGQVTHSLRQELTIVENYLRIQEIRFGKGLTTTIVLPDDHEWLTDIQVPALLLQIHTENAIESGIRNRPGASLFCLTINQVETGTTITIEDDGRGRPEPNPENTHKGSTSVMEDLIDLFNLYNAEPIQVKYEDRIQVTDGIPHGTRVHIHIPVNYRYDFS